ncbi:hypothetical protein EB796_007124 [Bugula neritina]|uniref:Sugar phosphate transporter domain-containing protein n=1 Tax=Bugula neritina TaxID=10212 RepID=A0A7J7KAI3_BUGNE|nr:hypothetical protein EB796_007124 [Bugula neritina]
MPMFTIVFSRIFLNETQTLPVYLSVVPIILGVCIATATETSFDLGGLISALVATMGFSCLNIFTKKSLKETGMHHLRMLHIITKITFLLFVPIWAFVDFRNILGDETVMKSENMTRSVVLLLMAGFSNFAMNVIAFTLIASITPVSYAVANATKRIVIIASSLFFLQNPVTTSNLCGMMVAVLGVLMYNKTKYDQTMAKRRESILPNVRSDSNLFRHNLHLSPLHRTHTELDVHNHFTILPSNGQFHNSPNLRHPY